MPDFVVAVFRAVNVGGTNGLESAGNITIQDDDGFRDDIFDDIEQAPSSETNGDQRVIASSVAELNDNDTIRTRSILRFTNNDTNVTFDVIEIFSGTATFPIQELFVVTSPPPDWLFDPSVTRTFSFVDGDGTTPFADIICFGAGTFIKAGDGNEVLIENLKVADRVMTQDGTAHAIRWIGSCKVSSIDLMAAPNLRPIRINAGALGCGLPIADLIVSPQHRVLVRSKIAQRIFGSNEVLVPANKLTQLDGINVADDIKEIEYFHIMFDEHRIVFSNGALTESLLPGPEAMKTVSPESRNEIETLFPEICAPDFTPIPASVVPQKGKHIKQLVARHHKNAKPLLAHV